MDNLGIVTISDRAVMQIAAYGAQSCSGIAELTAKSKQDEVTRTVMGRGDTSGVYVTKTKSGVILDVYAACKYGVDVSDVKEDAQSRVKDAFIGTGITIKQVVIHINSVK